MIRIDKAQFKIIETGEGFLKAQVTFAVPGVYPYIYADGIKLEAKLPDDILSLSTIDSARGAPITDDHPTDTEGNYVLVDSMNYTQYAKGNISEPVIVDGMGEALATIYDPVLIEEIKAKEKNHVSIGFSCDMDFTPGYFNGVKYDAAQKNIKINHLACVPVARSEMAYVQDVTKIHIDRGIIMSDKKIAAGAGEGTPDDSNSTFSYRKFDGSKDMAVSKELHTELMTLRNVIKDQTAQIKADQDQMEALKQEVAGISPTIPDPAGEEEKAALMMKIEELQAAVNAWKEKYGALEAAVPEMVDEMATEKIEVTDAARAVDGVTVDGLSIREIKLQVISKGLPFKEGIKIDGLSDEVINSRYDAAIDLLKAKANMPIGEKPKGDTRVDSSDIEAKKAGLKNMYRSKANGNS